MRVLINRAGVFLAAMLLVLAYPAFGDDEAKAGLPLPRFASLRTSEVNMRVGPGARYSINWVYKHEGLPVEITQEFEDWRKIRDSDGTVGWVHKQMLHGQRMAIIQKKIAVLRKTADENSGAVLRAEPGVTGKILECEPEWCRLQIAGRKGWVEKTSIWGVYKNEKF